MNIIGKIDAVLNETVVILSSSEPLNTDEIITVFAVISEKKLSEIGCPDPVHIPIGELKITATLGEQKFLAKAFQEEKEVTRKIYSSPQLLRGLAGAFAQLEPEVKEVREILKKDWSAVLNESESLGIDIPQQISVGDAVGRIL